MSTTYDINAETKAERQKLEQDLKRLKARFEYEMRGRGFVAVLPPKAARIKAEADKVQMRIDELDRKMSERLAFDRAPIDDVLGIIAVPLLADVINDMVAGVDGFLLSQGCNGTIFSDYTSQIRKYAMLLVDTLAKAEGSIPLLLDYDDTLVGAIEKKLMSFIKQRLKIKN